MKEDLQKAVNILKSGGTILYPTDTIWGIGCNATNAKAVDKIYAIKERSKLNRFIILLDSPNKILDYVKEVPDILWDLLKNIDSPTTIIYPGAKNLPKNVIAKDGSIAIRIVKHEFCQKLIHILNKPIISTSANFSSEPSPVVFQDITEELKEKVDYIVKTGRDKMNKSKGSTIIKLKMNGEFEIIRP
jgi:L-threonylcarbamoyladenylate synthase